MKRKTIVDPAGDYKLLPDYYLAGFTGKDRLEDSIWVLDRKLGIQTETTPRASASSVGADFRSLDADKTAAVINRIAEERALPAGSDFSLLMGFTAAMLLNLPAPRKMVDRFADGLAEKVLCLAADSKEDYQGFFAKIEADSGIRVPTFEEAADVLQRCESAAPEERRAMITSSLNRTELALAHIGNRCWSVIINENPDHLFITSDMPLVLVSLNESGYYGPNLRSPDTVVYLPLSRRVMLVGSPGGKPGTDRVERVREVARLNTLVIGIRARYIISTKENFVFMNSFKKLSFKDDLLFQQKRGD